MKKQLAMALAASVVMSAAGTVFAAENPYDFKFSGSINTQFRNDDRTNNFDGSSNVNASGLKTTITLNMEKALTENLALYSRFTHQSFNNKTAKEYQADWVDEDYNTAIDAFGLKYNNAGVNYVVGSQALTLGTTGILYDNGFLGRHALPYALKIDAKAGATNLTAVYAKTNYQDGVDNDKFYYLQGQYAVNDKANVGAFFAHAAYGNNTKNLIVNQDDSINYYGINTSYKLTNKLNFVAEFIKSDADRDDKGCLGGFTYAADNKNTFGASYYHVGDQAAIVDANLHSMTTAPFSNAKGYILSYNYKVNNNTTVAASYDTQDKLNSNGLAGADNDRNRTRVGVTFSF